MKNPFERFFGKKAEDLNTEKTDIIEKSNSVVEQQNDMDARKKRKEELIEGINKELDDLEKNAVPGSGSEFDSYLRRSGNLMNRLESIKNTPVSDDIFSTPE